MMFDDGAVSAVATGGEIKGINAGLGAAGSKGAVEGKPRVCLATTGKNDIGVDAGPGVCVEDIKEGLVFSGGGCDSGSEAAESIKAGFAVRGGRGAVAVCTIPNFNLSEGIS